MSGSIFFETALFACKCCGYKNEFLSTKEWATELKGVCTGCKKSDVILFKPNLLFYYDVEENYIFPVVPDTIHTRSFCKDHYEKDRMHWTNFVICCSNCNDYLMYFVEYTNGFYPDAYEKFAIEQSKLRAPDLKYDCKNGRTIYTTEFDFTAN
jgi:hypothetical protein